MVERVKAGVSHPYAKATAKDRQGEAIDIPADARALVHFCANRGLDQESISRNELRALASKAIEDLVNS
jgi:hypothetical protein